MRKKQIGVAAFGAAMAMAAVVQAVVISPTADSYIRRGTVAQALTDTNFGLAQVLAVRANGSPDWRKSYLTFTLPAGLDPATITDVTLNLTSVNSTGGSVAAWQDQTVSLYGIQGASWGEGTGDNNGTTDTSGNTITWNHAPSNNAASGSGFVSGTTLFGSFDGTGTTGALSIDGSDLTNSSLISFMQTAGEGGTFTLMLSTTGTLAQTIGSKDNSNSARRPYLDVTVPEPATLGLFGLCGTLGLLRRRRPA
jgi:hypothetical protein